MPYQKLSFNARPASDAARSLAFDRATGRRRVAPAPKRPTAFALAYVARVKAAREARS